MGLHGGFRGVDIVGMHPALPFAPVVADFDLAVTQHPLPSRGAVNLAFDDIPVPQRVIIAVERQLPSLLLLLLDFLGMFPAGNVHRTTQKLRHPTRRIPGECRFPCKQPSPDPFGALHQELELQYFAVGQLRAP